MNWDTIKGNWKQMKGKVREEWGDITDDEYEHIAGQRDQFVGTLQKKYGYARDEAERRVDNFANRYNANPPLVDNGIPGVQTGGHDVDGTPDTRGITEKVADAVTGDNIDDKTGKPVR